MGPTSSSSKGQEQLLFVQSTILIALSNFQLINKKLKDLVLREVIWTCAEHIRHCPQRINNLFFDYSKSNVEFYRLENNDLTQFFLREKYTDDALLPSKLEVYKPPVLDLKTVKGMMIWRCILIYLEGINLFKDSNINFDDIDECGKWREPNLRKTFYEPPGIALFFLLFKYCSSTIQVKLWLVFCLYFLE